MSITRVAHFVILMLSVSTPWIAATSGIRIKTVPHTSVAGWIRAVDKTAPWEGIGERIVEVPEDLEQFERRDPRALFIAYVPVGSVKAGEALTNTGGARQNDRMRGLPRGEPQGRGYRPGTCGSLAKLHCASII